MAFETLTKLADDYTMAWASACELGDKDLVEVYEDDIKLIEAVSFLLNMGERTKAFAILDDADTAIREPIEVALMEYPDVYNDWKKVGGKV